MMGAGKSTVGRLLAQRLGVSFFDSDAYIEERQGKTVAQIFRDDGEPAFRQWEAEAVSAALAMPTPVVLGVAGGAILRPDTRDALTKRATVVWLRAPVEVLIKRVVARHLDRPMIAEDPDTAMRRLYEERQPIYEALADQIIDAGDVTPVQAVDAIVERVL